ncbi:MAG: redox protein [Cyanobacteria bacterium J06656_5]
MFELYPFEKFRDTPSVQFFDITVPDSNARDLVFHQGPAISPHSAKTGDWQFYLHPRQEDNLLALSGGRTFYLVNFNWDHPFHRVRLNHNSRILRIPPGTFHRSESDPQGSLVINQAVRLASATVHSEFRVYNSAKIPKLKALLGSGLAPMDHGFPEQENEEQLPTAA